ncbi:hypothetical protein Z949_1569 [Sulfitobacter guttiformis KCTC 32187]|nr:hypothetical protein Z949_1569 [Sulfitobacter guttiformis KCTC 32187]
MKDFQLGRWQARCTPFIKSQNLCTVQRLFEHGTAAITACVSGSALMDNIKVL